MLGTGHDRAVQAHAERFLLGLRLYRQILQVDRIQTLVQATTKKAAKLLNDIIHRFGLPNSIITNLGSTFTSSDFWDFCDERCISVKYVSVAHPRANGQVERTNGMILDALKKWLHEKEHKHPGKWLKELPVVV